MNARVMSHVWMNERCHTYECISVHVGGCACHTYQWVVSHVWMSYVAHMNESCHTYEWVMSNVWMSYVTHMNESCHLYESVMSHVWMSYVTRMTCLINTCDKNYFCFFYVWHVFSVCGGRVGGMNAWVMSRVWHVSLIRVCVMTHSCVWHDSFICAT